MKNCASHKHCQQQALAIAEQICQSKGLRFTDIRKMVLSLIWKSHKPLKAYDILDKIKNYCPKPPTVYRALEFLQENGLVHKLNSINSYVGCSHPETHRQCYFLICNQCHQAHECCNENLTSAIAQTAIKNSFSATSVTVEIEGVCQSCTANK